MSKGMEKHEIYQFQLQAIQNVLRLTHNIYRTDAESETNFDRQLKKSRAFVDNALEGNIDTHIEWSHDYKEPKDREELKAMIIENMEGIIVDHEARSDRDILEFYADVFTTIAMDFKEKKEILILSSCPSGMCDGTITHCKCKEDPNKLPDFPVSGFCNCGSEDSLVLIQGRQCCGECHREIDMFKEEE